MLASSAGLTAFRKKLPNPAAGSVVGAGVSAVGAYWDYKGAKKDEPVIVTPPIEAY